MSRLLDDTDSSEGFKGYRDRLITEVSYVTSVHLSELIGLNDKDVGLLASLLKITGRRNKQRLIPFGDELKKAMFEHINMRSKVISVKSDTFFVGENGEWFCKNLVYNLVERSLSKAITLEKRGPHVLRHTLAVIVLNNDMELGMVKKFLGHSSLATTEIYTHTILEEFKKVYKQAYPRA